MTAFTAWPFEATGAPTPRLLPARLGELVNAFDYGAIGNGIADDTAALQAAIDAAFGPAGSPHGGADSATGYWANRRLFIPRGNYKITSPLVLTSVQGAHIHGAGKFATRIFNTTTSPDWSGTCLRSTAIKYSLIENLTLQSGAGEHAAFDMDWDNATTYGVGTHANICRNVRFVGGNWGCWIKRTSGDLGSECPFYDCDFINCATCGLICKWQNSLNIMVLGGKVENCGVGITSDFGGALSYIGGVNFSGSTVQDIEYRAPQGGLIEGCYSTSNVFARCWGSTRVGMRGCYYAPLVAGGSFCYAQTFLYLDACGANVNAILQGSASPYVNQDIYIRGCQFPSTFISGSTIDPTHVRENI